MLSLLHATHASLLQLAPLSPTNLIDSCQHCVNRNETDVFLFPFYCLTACLYAKCCNLIGWIMERGPSIYFRIDGPDHLYGFRSKLKHRIFGKMVEKLSTEVVKICYVRKIVGKVSETFRKKPETIDYYIFSRVFHQFTFGTNFPRIL